MRYLGHLANCVIARSYRNVAKSVKFRNEDLGSEMRMAFI